MDQQTDDSEFVREMRARFRAEGDVFRADTGEFAIFEPEAAKQVNARNFADFLLPDNLGDVLRGRSSSPIQWKHVRSIWAEQLHRISLHNGAGRMADQMDALLGEQLDVKQDLVWLIQQMFTHSLIPIVIDGLAPKAHRRVLDDQMFKLERLMKPPAAKTFWSEVRSISIQIKAGLAVRYELRNRAKGRRRRQMDLADSLVEILAEIGMDRAVDAVTTVLTAIAGPPGASGNAVLYEIIRHPEWAQRLRDELTPLVFEDFCAAPMRSAPMTHRFVKEVLRMWSPPLFMTRPVRTDIELDHGISLKEGERYFVSMYLMHHDPKRWNNPELFDPERWLPDREQKICPGSYVPFGWSPTSCVGAHLGMMQLMMFCYLMTVRYQVELEKPSTMAMALNAVATPIDFVGTVVRR